MPGAGRRAKLLPDIMAARADGQTADGPTEPDKGVLCRKGSATANSFRPPEWSYGIEATAPQAADAADSPVQPVQSAEPEPAASVVDTHTPEARAAQQALADGLAEIIESVLLARELAIAPARRTRLVMQDHQPDRDPPTPPSVSDAPVTTSEFKAALAQPFAVPADRSPPARPLADRLLGLISVLAILPAGYFGASLWLGDPQHARPAPPVSPPALSTDANSSLSGQTLASTGASPAHPKKGQLVR